MIASRMRWAVCLGILWTGVCAGQQAEPRLLFDFETGNLSESWSAIRDLSAARQELPAPIANLPGKNTRAVHLQTEGQAGFFAKSGAVPADWRKFETLSFWVYRSPREAEKHVQTVLEVQCYEADGKARYWRKLAIDHHGWKKFSLPLKWFRWGPGRVPRWDRVSRVGFWFRDQGDLWVDQISVTAGDSTSASRIGSEDLRQLAFPRTDKNRVTIANTQHVRLLTDAADLDAEKLAKHLEKVTREVFGKLDFLEKPPAPTPVVIFATREAYQAFTPRFAKQLGAAARAPTSGGFTLHGVSTSYWDADQGTLRPVYTHEYVHGLLAQAAGLPNQGEWLHEGFAVYFQLKFHPQANLAGIVREGIEKPSLHTPLNELTAGGRISLNRYWQAMTLVELLMEEPPYQRNLPKLFEAFAETGSTKLESHLPAVLQANWEKLTADWKSFCEKKYRPDE